jgi:glucose-6-phosphate 1-epimerase
MMAPMLPDGLIGGRFAADGVRSERGAGGLDRLVIDAAGGEAHVYLHGAHVTHFQPRGERPLLFLSKKSHFEGGVPGKAIRGGIPVCFPWFGAKADDASAPAHGFARQLPWQLDAADRNERGEVRVSLRLEPSEYTRRFFGHDFTATLAVTVGARLKLGLTVRNRGPAPMRIEEALHTYFAVGDARRVAIGGLEGVAYLDKTEGFARKAGASEPITLTKEMDRVYPDARGAVTIVDPVWGRRILVDKSGSATTVVWNPWVEKAKAMADFGDDEWIDMVCVETVNSGDGAVTIAPGQTHTMSAALGVQ